jgi:hypothetical protein
MSTGREEGDRAYEIWKLRHTTQVQTSKLAAAISRNQVPVRFSGEDVSRETALLENKSQEPRGREEWGQVRRHWTDQARFRWNGKKTCRRKGHMRNRQENRTLAGIRFRK